jgi:hypothetical protein
MYLGSLTSDQLTEAHKAADFLLRLPVRLDSVLATKLDTLRCDLGAAIEDRAPGGRARSETNNAAEPGLAEVEQEFPDWQITCATSGLWYATRRDDRDVRVHGEDLLDLRDELRRAEALST